MKKCKGIGKAKKVEGCGKKTEFRTYGLCRYCLIEWSKTKEGYELYVKPRIIPKAKNKVMETKKKEKEKTRQEKIDLMSCDKYRAKYVQPIINEIARLIDYGQPCIATGKTEGKMNGGHYHSVGSNRTLALNLHNIHIQSFYSNHHKSGDDKNYREGLRKVYGDEYLEYVEGLKQIPEIKLTKEDLIRIKYKAQLIKNELKSNSEKTIAYNRIVARNTVNMLLGIYDHPEADSLSVLEHEFLDNPPF